MYLNFYILLEMMGKNLGYCQNPTLARFLNQLGCLLSQLKYGYDKNFSTLVNSTRDIIHYSTWACCWIQVGCYFKAT
jgi:hypothetical protein